MDVNNSFLKKISHQFFFNFIQNSLKFWVLDKSWKLIWALSVSNEIAAANYPWNKEKWRKEYFDYLKFYKFKSLSYEVWEYHQIIEELIKQTQEKFEIAFVNPEQREKQVEKLGFEKLNKKREPNKILIEEAEPLKWLRNPNAHYMVHENETN